MIFMGYPGIGKTTLSKSSRCIDLESSNFIIDGERIPNWAKAYVNVAKDLSNQNFTVFVAMQKDVQDLLDNDDVIYIVPNLSLKDAWIEKLKSRYEASKYDKDFRAYIRAKDHFEEDISSILNDTNKNVYAISSMDYELSYVVAIASVQYSKRKELKEADIT